MSGSTWDGIACHRTLEHVCTLAKSPARKSLAGNIRKYVFLFYKVTVILSAFFICKRNNDLDP